MAYTAERPLEIGKIRFAIKKIQLLSEKKNYTGAKEVSDYLTGVWILTRPKLNKESKDMINQIEIAIVDLNKAIESKDDTIVAAKAEVILKLADKLEKANEKKRKRNEDNKRLLTFLKDVYSLLYIVMNGIYVLVFK